MTTTAQQARQTLTFAAAASFAANCAVGALAASRRERQSARRSRWVHHALFVSTTTLTAGAALTALATKPRAAGPLMLALVPLTFMPRVPGRSRAHPFVAAVAAPAYVAALIITRSPRNALVHRSRRR